MTYRAILSRINTLTSAIERSCCCERQGKSASASAQWFSVLHFQPFSTSFHNPMHTQLSTRYEASMHAIRWRCSRLWTKKSAVGSRRSAVEKPRQKPTFVRAFLLLTADRRLVYFAPTMRASNFASSGRSPERTRRGVSSRQEGSSWNARAKSGSASSMRCMLASATACQ